MAAVTSCENTLQTIARIAPRKRIQDSLGFRIPESNDWIPSIFQWNLHSGFQLLVGFRIPTAVFRIPRLTIPDFPEFGIRIPLHGQDYVLTSLLLTPSSTKTFSVVGDRMLPGQLLPSSFTVTIISRNGSALSQNTKVPFCVNTCIKYERLLLDSCTSEWSCLKVPVKKTRTCLKLDHCCGFKPGPEQNSGSLNN